MNKQVAVLLAVYRPNMDFLKQQLISLNEQTYVDMRIYICDDSQDSTVYEAISKLVREIIVDKPFVLFSNLKNSGSNQTFERLTQVAQGDYFAYCDQDDVWDKDKIAKQVKTLEITNASLVYSHLRVIDADNNLIAERFSDYNKRLQMVEGDNLLPFFLRRNCVTGCTMMIDSEIAKKALPFSSDYVHDHYLALCASAVGKIVLIKESLVNYRLHGNNQIGKTMLSGVVTKKDYLYQKLAKEYEKLETLYQTEQFTPQQKEAIMTEITMVKSRQVWQEKASLKNLMQLKSFYQSDKQLAVFETVLKLLPTGVANWLIKRVKE